MLKIELKWRVFLVVALGILISTLDSSILNIANPTIAREFGVDMADVQWVTIAYLLVITASLIFFGRLGDRLGSNHIYTWGFLIFALGSLACSLSDKLVILIIMRIFQGIGASMMMATGIGIISNIFPDDERGKALGLTGTIVALGNMLGPGLGGVLLGSLRWPAVFLINVPIGIIGFYLGIRYLPAEHFPVKKTRYDVTGAALMAAWISSLILAMSGNEYHNLVLLIIAGILLFVFCWWEKQSLDPLLDLDLFKTRTFIIGNLIGLIVYSVQNSVFFLLPFFLESVLGYSPVHSGLLMTAAPIFMAFSAPVAGHLSDKFGSPRIITLSLALLTGAFMLLSTLQINSSHYHIAAAMIVLGIGMGTFGSPNTSAILGSMPKQKAGYGGGFISTNRNLSYSLGISASVLLFNLVFSHHPKEMDYSTAFIQAIHTVHMTAAFITVSALVLWIIWHSKDRQGLSSGSSQPKPRVN